MHPGRRAPEGEDVNDDLPTKGAPVPLSTRSRRFAAGLTLSLAVTATAAACGDDGGSTAAPSTTAAGAVPTAACDALTALSGALAGDPSGAGPVIDAFESTAPSALTDDAKVIADTYRGLLGPDGDPAAFAQPAFQAADEAVSGAYFAGCNLADRLDVTGVDYGYEGIPRTVDAGRVGFTFTNGTTHELPHEMVLMKRNPGTDETAHELLMLPRDEQQQKLTMAGVVFVDHPGAHASALLDVTPGRYVVLCMIPMGEDETGPTHAMSGMVAEFEAA